MLTPFWLPYPLLERSFFFFPFFFFSCFIFSSFFASVVLQIKMDHPACSHEQIGSATESYFHFKWESNASQITALCLPMNITSVSRLQSHIFQDSYVLMRFWIQVLYPLPVYFSTLKIFRRVAFRSFFFFSRVLNVFLWSRQGSICWDGAELRRLCQDECFFFFFPLFFYAMQCTVPLCGHPEWCGCKGAWTEFFIIGLWDFQSLSSNQVHMPIVMDSTLEPLCPRQHTHTNQNLHARVFLDQ